MCRDRLTYQRYSRRHRCLMRRKSILGRRLRTNLGVLVNSLNSRHIVRFWLNTTLTLWSGHTDRCTIFSAHTNPTYERGIGGDYCRCRCCSQESRRRWGYRGERRSYETHRPIWLLPRHSSQGFECTVYRKAPWSSFIFGVGFRWVHIPSKILFGGGHLKKYGASAGQLLPKALWSDQSLKWKIDMWRQLGKFSESRTSAEYQLSPTS